MISNGNGLVKISNQDENSSLIFGHSFQAHSSYIWRIKQSPYNKPPYVATCSDDYLVKIWIPFNWTLLRTYSNHSSEVYGLEWLDADTLASSGESDQTIKIWSVSSGQTKKIINTGASVWSLKLLSSNYLAVGLNQDINIYDINDGIKLKSTFKGHTNDVRDLVQLNSNTLASASLDWTVRIWDLTLNKCKFILKGHTSDVMRLKQVTSNILASGSADTTIKLWDVTNGQLIRNLTGHTGGIEWSLETINNGKILLSGSLDHTIRKWNWSSGECLQTIQTNSDIISMAVID